MTMNMLKKTMMLMALTMMALTAAAQNIQLHYDFGRNI